MLQQFQTIKQRLAARPDTEHHQALLRLLIGTAAGVILLLHWDSISARGDAFKATLGLGAFYVLAIAILANICVGPVVSVPRRYLGMITDVVFVTITLILGKDDSTQGLVMIYLWIILGNGLRYGQRYLVLALILSLASFFVVLQLNKFWHELLWFGWEILIGQACIALYMLSLVVRLNKAVEREAAANNAKRTFVSRMSHEMRTPLNNIMGSADLVLGTKLSSDQQQLLRVLQESSIHLRRLIDDVLDFSKIEAGKLTLELREIDVRELLWSTANMLHPQAHAKKIGMDVQIDRLLPQTVQGDELRIRQILLNLAGNAIKFTETGFVRLEVAVLQRQETKALLRFSVRDTGIGIPAEKIAKIFESFGQADESVTRKYGGTGLGVTISQNLIQLMGGELQVESAPGVGSVFSFQVAFDISALGIAPHRQIWAATGMSKDEAYGLRDIVEQWGIALAFFDDLSKLAAERTQQYAGLLAKSDLRQQMLGAKMFARGRELPLILSSLNRNIADAPELKNEVWLKWPIDRFALFRAINSAAQPQQEESPSLPPPPARLLKVLVVDDIRTNLMTIEATLKRDGHTCATTESANRGLELCTSEHWDLLICDQNMPEMDGVTLVKELRAIEAMGLRRTAIIMLTGDATDQARSAALAAGVDTFLTKPIRPVELARAIAALRFEEAGEPQLAAAPQPMVPDTVFIKKRPDDLEEDVDDLVVAGLTALKPDPDFVPDLMRRVVAECYQYLETVAQARAVGDIDAIREIIHALYGSAGGVGFVCITRVCDRFPKLKPEEINTRAAEFESQFKRAVLRAEEYLARHGSAGRLAPLDSHH